MKRKIKREIQLEVFGYLSGIISATAGQAICLDMDTFGVNDWSSCPKTNNYLKAALTGAIYMAKLV